MVCRLFSAGKENRSSSWRNSRLRITTTDRLNSVYQIRRRCQVPSRFAVPRGQTWQKEPAGSVRSAISRPVNRIDLPFRDAYVERTISTFFAKNPKKVEVGGTDWPKRLNYVLKMLQKVEITFRYRTKRLKWYNGAAEIFPGCIFDSKMQSS